MPFKYFGGGWVGEALFVFRGRLLKLKRKIFLKPLKMPCFFKLWACASNAY